jgi:hypothetical protein
MENQVSAVSFKLGKSFPLAPHEGDTVVLKLVGGSFSLIVYQTTPTQKEIDAIARGAMELSLLLLPVDPHLFLDVELDTKETLQSAFYIKSCSPETQKLIISQGAPQSLRIFLVDTPSNRLMAMRTISFDEDFSVSFYMALKGQTLSSYEPIHIEGSALDTEMKYTPAEGYEYIESHLDAASLEDSETEPLAEEEPAKEDTIEDRHAEDEVENKETIKEEAAEETAVNEEPSKKSVPEKDHAKEDTTHENPVKINPEFTEEMEAAIKDVLSRYPAPKVSRFFCYYCGTPLIEGAHFCYRCGKRQPEF